MVNEISQGKAAFPWNPCPKYNFAKKGKYVRKIVPRVNGRVSEKEIRICASWWW